MRPVKILFGLACAALLAGCDAASSADESADKGPPLAARFGVALDGRPITTERLDALARAFAARPAYVVVFEQWPEHPGSTLAEAAPTLGGLAESLAAIRAAGATPVVTWEPMYYRADGTEVILLAEEIVGGRYDAYLDAFAELIAAQPGETLVRLMHEPNLARYHWGVTAQTYDADAPEVYRRLWRHLVDRVRLALGPEHAHLARFAFCPNAESVPGPGNSPDHAWNTLGAWWPGAEWVDVIGVDGYNWGDTQTPEKHGWRSQWRQLADVLGPAVAEVRALAPDLPFYIFETASASTGGDKAAWLHAAAAAALGWEVRALCWFEADKEIDWRLAAGVGETAARTFVRRLLR